MILYIIVIAPFFRRSQASADTQYNIDTNKYYKHNSSTPISAKKYIFLIIIGVSGTPKRKKAIGSPEEWLLSQVHQDHPEALS